MGTCQCKDDSKDSEGTNIESWWSRAKNLTSTPQISLSPSKPAWASHMVSHSSLLLSDTVELEEIPNYLSPPAQLSLSEVNSKNLFSQEFDLLEQTHRKPVLLNDKSVFLGEITGNSLLGRGERHYPDGSFSKGTWEKGELEGYGLCIMPNGDYYIGQFIRGMMQGEGSMRYVNGGLTHQGY